MKQVSVAEILEPCVRERIWLLKLIWDSIAAVPEAVEVTSELKAELEGGCKSSKLILNPAIRGSK